MFEFKDFVFDVGMTDPETNEQKTAKERFYCIVVTKQRPLDVK